MSSKHSDFYYRFAVGSCVLSAVTTVSVLILVPLLCSRASWDRSQIAIKSERFRMDMNRLWGQIYGRGDIMSEESAAIYFTKVKRSPWDKHVCAECHQLSCPVGMPGSPGNMGADGESGASGMPGKPGDDGYDVELEPQDDLPCVICPAGPPGLRGMQGERGQSGLPGRRGEQGRDGNPGTPGPQGHSGKAGLIGQRGSIGTGGQTGETIVAGVGIKGPNGPPGPPGPKGPIGRPGKPSRDAGPVGPPGPVGSPGNPGAIGRQGDDGDLGMPGEPGEPAAYCHSDCGVSKILAPSVGEMMTNDMHGDVGYSSDSKQPEAIASNYNQDVHPVHSVGTNAYSGYMNSAVQVQ